MAENTATTLDGPWTDFQQTPQMASPEGGPWTDFQNPATAKPNFGIMDTWPVRLAKDALDLAALPGNVNAGITQVPQSANFPALPNQSGGEDTSAIPQTTQFAAMFSPLSRAGSPSVVAPPTNEMLRDAKNAGYERALNAPIEIKPQAMSIVRQKIATDLENDGINEITAPVTFNLLKKFDAPNGAVGVTPQNLRAIQKSLNLVKNKNADDTERLAAGSVVNQFNNFLESMHEFPQVLSKGTPQDALNFSQNVKWANANNTSLKTAEMFDQRFNTAEVRTNASHSGMNFENNLRSQAAQVLSKPSLQRGMSPETLRALRDFNAGSRSENTLRLISNVFGGGGGLGMLAAGAAGHALGLPLESIPAIGFALKSMANRRAAQGFSAIGDTVRASSPLAQIGAISRSPASPFIGRGAALGMPMLGINPAPLTQPAY